MDPNRTTNDRPDPAGTSPAPAPSHESPTPLHQGSTAEPPDTIETRLWSEERAWLQDVLRSEANASPTFHYPDLISACVSRVFLRPDAPARIFGFLGTQLVLRPPRSPRWSVLMWRDQYQLLLALQRSPANRHPNPKFQLDQLTTACVALCRDEPDAESHLLYQARLNMAERAMRARSGSTS